MCARRRTLALAFYAPARATVDLDINVFVPPGARLEPLPKVLNHPGFQPDDPANLARSTAQDGQFRGRVAGLRADVLVPAFEFYGSMAEGRRRLRLLDHPIDIVGPGGLLVLKVMFLRRKDLADVEAALRESGHLIDIGSVRTALVAVAEADDERIRERDQIVAETSDGRIGA